MFLWLFFLLVFFQKPENLQSGVKVNLSQVFRDGVICRGFDSLMDPGMAELAGINARIWSRSATSAAAALTQPLTLSPLEQAHYKPFRDRGHRSISMCAQFLSEVNSSETHKNKVQPCFYNSKGVDFSWNFKFHVLPWLSLVLVLICWRRLSLAGQSASQTMSSVHEFSSSPLSKAAAPPGANDFSCLVMYCFPLPQRLSLSWTGGLLSVLCSYGYTLCLGNRNMRSGCQQRLCFLSVLSSWRHWIKSNK